VADPVADDDVADVVALTGGNDDAPCVGGCGCGCGCGCCMSSKDSTGGVTNLGLGAAIGLGAWVTTGDAIDNGGLDGGGGRTGVNVDCNVGEMKTSAVDERVPKAGTCRMGH